MDAIAVERRGATALVTFRRPAVMNAWDRAMRREITEACLRLEAEPAVRAVVFTGEGDRAFGAGQDLREGSAATLDAIDPWVAEWQRFYSALRGLSKPSVAAVNGVCAGSAFQFALMADFRVGHPGVRMGQPEIKAGVASSLGPWIIDAVLGHALAVDLSLTGRLMDGAECQARGLLSRVVPAGTVVEAALALAAELGAHPPLAMALTKQRLAGFLDEGFTAAFDVWKANLRATLAG